MDKAAYTLLLDFGDGFEDFSDRIILSDGYTPRLCIGRGGTHEIQTVNLSLYNSAGIGARLATTDEAIPAMLLRDGITVMSGIVRPFNTSRAALDRVQPISLSILDRSAMLEQYVFESKRWTGLTLITRSNPSTSLIHKLFMEAGVQESDILVDFDRSESIPCYALSNGDYISARIQEALYEYGLTYRATAEGKFRIIDVGQQEIVPDLILGSDDLRTDLSLVRSDSSNKGSVVRWYPILSKSQATVFEYDLSDGPGTLTANGVFPLGSDTEGYRLPYDISELTDGKLLAIANPRLHAEPAGLQASSVTDFGQDDCSAYLLSTVASEQSVTAFKVLADVWYQGKTYSQQVVQGSKPKTYTSKVISDAGSAQMLARILSLRQTFGQQSYSFESLLALEPGQVVSILEDKVSHLDVTVRILSQEFDASTSRYRYTAEGTGDIDLTIPVEQIDAIENALGKPRKGDPGEDAYQVQVISHNGTVFRMNGFETIMEARVWQGGKDITDEFTDADFRWRRTSEDPFQDELWNSAHYSTGGRSISVTQDDVVGRSNFFVDLLRERS